jgi:hypothetical protein
LLGRGYERKIIDETSTPDNGLQKCRSTP